MIRHKNRESRSIKEFDQLESSLIFLFCSFFPGLREREKFSPFYRLIWQEQQITDKRMREKFAQLQKMFAETPKIFHLK